MPGADPILRLVTGQRCQNLALHRNIAAAAFMNEGRAGIGWHIQRQVKDFLHSLPVAVPCFRYISHSATPHRD
jgi:hypothetical protein